jgi:hypothetical protein
MSEYPDFLNVRKLALILAGGPLAFLLLLSLADLSWHHFRVWQSAGVWCTQSTEQGVVKLYGTPCQK